MSKVYKCDCGELTENHHEICDHCCEHTDIDDKGFCNNCDVDTEIDDEMYSDLDQLEVD